MGTPLSDFVKDFLARDGMSRNEFASRCIDPERPDERIYLQWISHLVDGRGPMPELWRLRALAAAMRIDVDELKRLSIIQWLDYEPNSAPTPLLLTIPEAAEQLRVHRTTVYDLVSDGELEAIDIARTGASQTRLRVPRSSLLAYIASRPRVIGQADEDET